MQSGKKATKKLVDVSKQPSSVPQEPECYEGERLGRLLKLISREIGRLEFWMETLYLKKYGSSNNSQSGSMKSLECLKGWRQVPLWESPLATSCILRQQ